MIKVNCCALEASPVWLGVFLVTHTGALRTDFPNGVLREKTAAMLAQTFPVPLFLRAGDGGGKSHPALAA